MKRSEAFEIRDALDGFITSVAENAVQVNGHMACIRPWHEGAYAVGDVRMHEGAPYKCVQAHDSTGNPAWNPAATPALWMQYHGTTKETARDWTTPAGSHDMYKAGEYMVWTDGQVYCCLTDTVYSPEAYGAAWEKV